ncbi:hypothetical protein M378DRAFT_1045249 [Amanita muscaria Koide BX008]|uniref:Macrofage activating glycoprotein n=1 Tax=Amanita muscaria (strain Koide BX008) TaxID=946122 RepID=A0A0C2TBM9_AMAMK|nr:hypothetical protein M378DRAFT_1045249 [Amanita muscaria Koide BX008]
MSVRTLVLGLAPFLSLFHSTLAQTYSATYLPSNAPNQTENGQSGTNQCGTALNQNSACQNAYINNITDWCIWSPPEPGPNAGIGNTERIEVAWCIKSGYGTRIIPDGSITGAHFVVTPDFVQVTGVGNLTTLNVPAGDAGGELDPHGADGNGNPVGGLVFSNAFGQLEEIFEWTNFVSDSEFCFRACKPGPMAPTWCQHIYDTIGCAWNMPANYAPGVFEQCLGDSGQPMGVYGTSTFFQGEPVTPPAHPIPSSSSCTTLSTIGNGFFISGTSIATTNPASATATATAAGKSGSGVSVSSTSSGPSNSNTAATGTSTGNAGFSRGATVNNGDWILFTAGTAVVGSLVGAILVL